MNEQFQLDTFSTIASFVLDEARPIPESALQMGATLLLDTVGVAAGASTLEVAKIANETALDFYAAGSAANSAPILFDGRRASLVGAAYAAATQIDNLDAHDGYNPTRGHIGCAVVPALFAFAEKRPELTGRQALAALVISYEVAARAGIALHDTVEDYHTSGAWNALGVAALGCRIMGSSPDTLRHALGIAEYHGPRSQMMREIDNPTMLHDGSGMGALTGVSAALLADRGFQGAPALTIEADEVAPIWADLGQHWTVELNYIKPYPICRWAHAAIDAVRGLMIEHKFTGDDVAKVEIRTFHEASRLIAGMPKTTSEAQYSLAFAVSVLLRYDRIGPEHVQGAALKDDSVAELVHLVSVTEDAKHSSRFPKGRWSDVTIHLKDGRSLDSGDVHARGGPESPMESAEISEKFHVMTDHVIGRDRAKQIWQTGENLLDGHANFGEFAALVYPSAG